jgi:hypothetical protein
MWRKAQTPPRARIRLVAQHAPRSASSPLRRGFAAVREAGLCPAGRSNPRTAAPAVRALP